MNACDFQTTVCGKWILTGEHAVLRGCPEILFPIHNLSLQLHYWETPSPFEIEFKGHVSDQSYNTFNTVIEKALHLTQKNRDDITGKFIFNNAIPIGVGLGASAAFCLATAKWFAWKQWLHSSEIYSFARTLEDIFHGESSGADIAVIQAQEAIEFNKQTGITKFVPNWQPQWYLSYSGNIGLTSECIALVKELWERDPKNAASIDATMFKSVIKAKEALQLNKDTGFSILVDAIDMACSCFEAWGLISAILKKHLQQLTSLGAVTVKPTGAGMGGYVLSLWNKEPDNELLGNLIRLNLSEPIKKRFSTQM